MFQMHQVSPYPEIFLQVSSKLSTFRSQSPSFLLLMNFSFIFFKLLQFLYALQLSLSQQRILYIQMPRQLITIQVGQCGNQIGLKFWDLLLQEHAKYNSQGVYDEALSSFFRNTDRGSSLKIGSPIQDLKARAIVIDMQQGVTNQLLKSDIGEIFDQKSFVNDVSGAGNNWAHGFYEYGNKYRVSITQNIRKATQQCDSLQSFFLLHSLGGGTGSGLGSYVVGLLEDEFPEIFRFTASVFPSQKNDDVVTSPYNSLFSLYQLMKHSDCSLPIDNQALLNIVDSVQQMASKNKGSQKQVAKGSQITGKQKRPYDKMNNIIANLLSNLTCSMRFEGVLNVDFNQITMNLVPYPDLHFLVSSIAPLYSLADPRLQPRKLDQIFHDIYDEKYQLIECNPFSRTYLAMGLIMRGKVPFSDVNRNIKIMREKKNLRFVHWNTQGFKYGICNTPPVGQDYSLLCLANNTCISDKFLEMEKKFSQLYNKKIYVHHYEKYLDDSNHFDETREAVLQLVDKYRAIQNQQPKPILHLKTLTL